MAASRHKRLTNTANALSKALAPQLGWLFDSLVRLFMQLPNVHVLPEAVPAVELQQLFVEALSASAPTSDKIDVLIELADKQWHTYERISPELATEISKFINATWNPTDLPQTEMLLSIVGHLGLDASMSLFLAKAKDPETALLIRSEILEASREFGDLALDPYIGMQATRK